MNQTLEAELRGLVREWREAAQRADMICRDSLAHGLAVSSACAYTDKERLTACASQLEAALERGRE